MAFSEALRLSIRKRAHFRCCICRLVGVEIHHIIPQEEQGPDTEENAAPLCPSCHELYGANKTKRKFIREARDFWYELCSNQESRDGGLTLASLSEFMAPLATKGDLTELRTQLSLLLTKDAEATAPTQKARKKLVPIERFIRSLYEEELEADEALFEFLFDSRAWYEYGEDSYDLLDRRALFLKLFGERTANRVCLIAARDTKFDINGFTEEDFGRVLHAVHVIVVLVTNHKDITSNHEAFECTLRPDGEFEWRVAAPRIKRPRSPAKSKSNKLKSKARSAEG